MVEAIDRLLSQGVPSEKIIVNNRIAVAHVTGVRGVQLTHQSIGLPKVKNYYDHLRIGCSVHSTDEAINAADHGADYLVYGHIFESGSKPGLAPRGLKNLQDVAESTTVPVIAIGGITPENTRDVLAAGASGIAVLSGVLLARNPLEAVRSYRRQLAAVGDEKAVW